MAAVTSDLDLLCVNVLRGLAIDAVQRANSGHPGLPLGCAPMAWTLWSRHLRHDPTHPDWIDRDRFILSAGHGSMLLYALLHLTGYDLSLDELKNFRQWGSKTPGHPENHLTPGVEMATGPLGQGAATSVGMAIAEKFLSAKFNQPGHAIIDHFTYALVSDGDLMEGITQEAASLAGHLELGKLIWLYDDNQITIDGRTDLTFRDQTGAKFESIGWHVQHTDGMDMDAVDKAIRRAKADPRPSIIVAKTVIGFGSPHKAGTSKAHGSPLGPDEVKLTKEALGLPVDQDFYIPEEALMEFRRAVSIGDEAFSKWQKAWTGYASAHHELAREFTQGTPVVDAATLMETMPAIDSAMATRAASDKVLNAYSSKLPTLLSGSADLSENVCTVLHNQGTFQHDTPIGRNVAYGIREHAMAACVNGITLHGGTRALGGTFLVFSDYCKPSLRLAALMEIPSLFAFSHDSIGLGEDGPTHQPIEHLAQLRAIPNFNLMRPADANEVRACWATAMSLPNTPSAVILTRQSVPAITSGEPDHPALRGGYILRDAEAPQICLVATGSEVSLALSAADLLANEGIKTRVVSLPSWFIFEKQDATYRQQVIDRSIPTVSVEAGSTFGWARYSDAQVGIDTFGASAPADRLFKEFGFTAENVAKVARSVLSR